MGSNPFFNGIKKFFSLFSKKSRKNKESCEESERKYFKEEIFIFTSITEDSLILARSIEKHCKTKKRERDPLIIFAGYDIPPYDKDDELHREVMMNGYIYQSYYKTRINEKEKPLITLLGFAKKKNNPIGTLYNRRINVFSLGNDKKELGFESVNSDIAFNDISAFLDIEFSEENIEKKAKYLKKKKIDAKPKEELVRDLLKANVAYESNYDSKYDCVAPGLLYIKYFILSANSINYEFYDKKIIEILRERFIDEKDKDAVNFLNKKIYIKSKDEIEFIDQSVANQNANALKKEKKQKLANAVAGEEEKRKIKEQYDLEIAKYEKAFTVFEFFKVLFQTKVINEAYLSGFDLAKKRNEIQVESIADDATRFFKEKDSSKRVERYKYSINRVKNYL